MDRRVQPEMLDQLPAEDPRARRSRRDIGRLNGFMVNDGLIADALKKAFPRHLAIHVVDLGGGGGEFLLRVARRVRGKWRGVNATLVDRHPLLESETQARFAELKWETQSVAQDVFQWLAHGAPDKVEAIVANLFLHQFSDDQLRELLARAAERARLVVAVEPRRTRRALWLSRCVGLLGCNSVTRYDAPVSVRAGFEGRELSALWPDTENWDVTERPVGLLSHLFVASRKEQAEAALFKPIVSAVFDRPSNGAPAGRPLRNTVEPESSSRPEA